MRMFIAACMFFISCDAWSYSINFGGGVWTESPSISDVKVLTLGVETDLGKYNMFRATEVGYWDDRRRGANNAFFANTRVGWYVRTILDLELRASVGISLQTTTDNVLGGYAQIAQSYYVGFRDDSTFIGATFMHLSSAGIFKPNHGRDFLMLTVGFGF